MTTHFLAWLVAGLLPLAAAMASMAAMPAMAVDMQHAEPTAQQVEPQWRPGVGTEFVTSHDSDGFQMRKVDMAYFPYVHGGTDLFGLRLAQYHYQQRAWRKDGYKLSLVWKEADPVTLAGCMMEAGGLVQGRYALLTLDGGCRHAAFERTLLDVFVQRDYVETQPALDHGVSYTFAGLGIEQGIGAHVTLVGIGAQQYFSDGNRRDHARVKLIYQPWLERGITLQLRYRTYRSAAQDVGRRYFNPPRYSESMLAASWRQRHGWWTGAVVVGLGYETIDDAPRQSTRLLELSLQRDIDQRGYVRLRAGYNRSASYYGPSYHYRYLSADLVFRF
ncbi:hypothetical protein [Cupriavidus necator]